MNAHQSKSILEMARATRILNIRDGLSFIHPVCAVYQSDKGLSKFPVMNCTVKVVINILTMVPSIFSKITWLLNPCIKFEMLSHMSITFWTVLLPWNNYKQTLKFAKLRNGLMAYSPLFRRWVSFKYFINFDKVSWAKNLSNRFIFLVFLEARPLRLRTGILS